MQSHDPDDSYILLCRMLRRFRWLRLRPLCSVAGLAYQKVAAGHTRAPQPRQGGAGPSWWLESKQQAWASQARKLSVPLLAPEESEAGDGAGPSVVAQGEPSWACAVCLKQMASRKEGRKATVCVVST